MTDPLSVLVDQLRATLAKLEISLSYVEDGIVLTGTDGRVEWCNSSFDRLVGRTHIEIVGKRLVDLLPLRRRGRVIPAAEHPVARALGPGEKVRAECELGSGDGVHPVEITATRVGSPSGGTTSLVVIRSRVERQRWVGTIRSLESQLEAAREESQEICALIGRHVQETLDLAMRSVDGTLDTRMPEDRRRAQDALRALRTRVDDLLRLADVVRPPLRHADVDLSAVSREISGHLAREDPQRRAVILVPDGLRASGDAFRLRLAMETLLRRAWSSTRSQRHTRIEVGRAAVEDEMVLFVRDNGLGLDPASDSLASVRWIVRRHGGRIWTDADAGGGSTVYFSLPEPSESAVSVDAAGRDA